MALSKINDLFPSKIAENVIPSELFLDLFLFLDLNEVEKCQLVGKRWRNIIYSEKSKKLQMARRLANVQIRDCHFWSFFGIKEKPVTFLSLSFNKFSLSSLSSLLA